MVIPSAARATMTSSTSAIVPGRGRTSARHRTAWHRIHGQRTGNRDALLLSPEGPQDIVRLAVSPTRSSKAFERAVAVAIRA